MRVVTPTASTPIVSLILGEHFGSTVECVGSTLLARGRQPFGPLVSATGLTPKQLREGLFILMQHGIVTYTEASEGLRVIVHYSISPLAVLLRDRFPLYISIARARFGPQGFAIVSEILKQGKCNFTHLINTHFPDISTAPMHETEAFEDAFNSLCEQQFVMRVADDDSLTAVDRRLAEEVAEHAKNPHMTANEKLKMKKSLDARRHGVEYEDMPTGMKRKVVWQYDEVENKAAKMHEEDDKDMANKFYWRINPSRFHIHTRNEGLCNLAEARINSSAKAIMKQILGLVEPSMKHCKADDVTSAVTLTQLASNMDLSELTFHPSTTRAGLTDYMTLLTQEEEFPLLSKEDERGGGQYVVNLLRLNVALQEALVLNYVQERHGLVGARIWRLLKTKGMLGEKEVGKLALVSNKVARETLFALMNSGMIFLQDVPKTVDHAPSRTTFLFYVSLPKCVEALVHETYKMIANVKLRRLKEYNANGALIEKIQRTDIQADESLLTDGERMGLDRFNGMIDKLRVSELRLDQALLILRDY
ncbi:DNA-directed RNA polymerase III subunit RPC3 [Chytriomyces hyalinus]|nr:DNA-directed RNA polymerase III subunit RPC3 [Chytriomyces hyalinus]